jgi:hypothetical protein
LLPKAFLVTATGRVLRGGDNASWQNRTRSPVFFSDNQGEHWDEVLLPFSSPARNPAGIGVSDFVAHRGALYFSNVLSEGIWKSSDPGANVGLTSTLWPLSDGSVLVGAAGAADGQRYYLTVACAPMAPWIPPGLGPPRFRVVRARSSDAATAPFPLLAGVPEASIDSMRMAHSTPLFVDPAHLPWPATTLSTSTARRRITPDKFGEPGRRIGPGRHGIRALWRRDLRRYRELSVRRAAPLRSGAPRDSRAAIGAPDLG